jgi:hypothetical protein
MNTQPTPETDAAWACFKGYMELLQDVQDLSRKLERERNEAREKIELSREWSAAIADIADNLRSELTAVTAQRDMLADLVKQFIAILDITEESDSGRFFHPTNITSCRAGDLQKIGELVEALRRASKPTNRKNENE